MGETFVNIALNLPLERLFTYRVPPELKDDAVPGKRALVSFGNKIMTGLIVESVTENIPEKIKDIN